MRLLRIASLIFMGVFVITGIEMPTEETRREGHPIMNFLTELTFYIMLITPMVYIILN